MSMDPKVIAGLLTEIEALEEDVQSYMDVAEILANRSNAAYDVVKATKEVVTRVVPEKLSDDELWG